MNERMIDIAIEANDQTDNEFDLNHKPLDAFLAKFAELIVKECMNVMLVERQTQLAEFYAGKKQDVNTLLHLTSPIFTFEKIGEHFGVEE